MKKLFAIAAVLFVTAITSLMATTLPKGEFEESLQLSYGFSTIYYYVPEDYTGVNTYPLILATCDKSNSGSILRQNLKAIANILNAILICPADDVMGTELVEKSLDHAIKRYHINDTKIVLSGSEESSKVLYEFAESCPGKAVGIISYNPALENYIPSNELIRNTSSAVISGNLNENYKYALGLESAYKNKNGNCLLIVIDEIIKHNDKEKKHYSKILCYNPYQSDWLSCYDYVTNQKTAPVIETDDINIRIFPNPASDKLLIEANNWKLTSNSMIDIYSANGNLVMQKTHFDGEAVDLTGLPNGSYILRISNKDLDLTKRFVIFR